MEKNRDFKSAVNICDLFFNDDRGFVVTQNVENHINEYNPPDDDLNSGQSDESAHIPFLDSLKKQQFGLLWNWTKVLRGKLISLFDFILVVHSKYT